MCTCKAATAGWSSVTDDAGSATGGGDSDGVTDACRLRPRRDLSRIISADDLGCYCRGINEACYKRSEQSCPLRYAAERIVMARTVSVSTGAPQFACE